MTLNFPIITSVTRCVRAALLPSLLYTLLHLPPLQLAAQEFSMSPGQKIVLRDLPFQKNLLAPAANAVLDRVGAYLKARPNLKFEIGVHSDAKGTSAADTRLTEERAISVKAYLVTKFGLKSEGIATKGYSGSAPVAGESAEGRAQNRRVEFIAQTALSGRYITDIKSGAVNNDAAFTVIHRDVQTQAPWDDDFALSRQGAPIYENHKIRTGDVSRAEVLLTGGSLVQVRENSIVTLVASPSTEKEKTAGNVSIERGGAKVSARGIRSNEQFIVKTPAANLTLQSADTKVFVDRDGRTAVAVHQGVVDAEAGDVVAVKEGYGIQIRRNGVPEVPHKLPETPQFTSPGFSMPLPKGGVRFAWSPTADRTRLEIATDSAFNTPVVIRFSAAREEYVTLDPGKYFWHLICVDSVGLEGKPTDIQTLTILGQQEFISKPRLPRAKLTITSPLEQTSIVGSDQLTIAGTADANSRVYLNDTLLAAPENFSGSFSRDVRLKRGSNVFRFEVIDKNGGRLEDAYFVDYIIPNPVYYGFMLMPVVPIGYASIKTGVAGGVVVGYAITKALSGKLAFNFGAVTTDGSQQGRSGITEFLLIDVGASFDLYRGGTLIPYIEAGAGLFNWTNHLYVEGNTRGAAVFAPGAGAGVRFEQQGRAFLGGLYYRFIFDTDNQVDLRSTNQSHSMLELRLGMTFN